MTPKTANFRPGDKVQYGEFPATIIRHYYENMWEVRVPGGPICVSGSDLKLVKPAAPSTWMTYLQSQRRS